MGGGTPATPGVANTAAVVIAATRTTTFARDEMFIDIVSGWNEMAAWARKVYAKETPILLVIPDRVAVSGSRVFVVQ
jgi:hypothetical protein